MSANEVVETFFALDAKDIPRATQFYVSAFGASVSFSSADWASLHVAGVRIGLARSADYRGSRTGLHFAVRDLGAACSRVESAGGAVENAPTEVAPGVVISIVRDTEGTVFTLVQR
ncbi:MAG: VOC family protein [Polyangiaceae bacterium]